MLQLTFLGTSAGVPTKQRNVTALAIECLNPYLSGANQQQKSRPWLLIDCGEGTQQQLLYTPLSLHQLTAICITHVHGDHCYGLPGLLASAAMSGRRHKLTIIAPKAIAKLLEAVKITTELYLPFNIDFMAIEDVLIEQEGKITIALDKQQQLDIAITPLSHRVPSHAFSITQTISQRTLDTGKLIADGIPASALWGKLQQGQDVDTEEGQHVRYADYVHDNQRCTKIVVAGDNDNPDLLTQAVIGADVLVHEATYTSDVLARIQAKNPEFDPMHSSAQGIGRFSQDNNIKNLILTHFSARYQSFDNPQSATPNMGHIRQDAQSTYQGNLWLAADFAQYVINSAKESEADNCVQYLGSVRDDK